MIVECYSADVYCECGDHEYGEPGSERRPAVFTGKNKREADRERRKSGWIKVEGKDVCPQCKTRKPLRLSEYFS